jgi:hypothetical protein
VIGDGDGLHAALEHLREQVVEAYRAVEKAILRVQMKVRKFGHARRASLFLPARAIQRKSIHSLSTASLLRLAASLLVVGGWASGCAGSGNGAVVTGDFVLAAEPATVGLALGGSGTVRFVLTSDGVPVAGQAVSFTFVDTVEAQGATLDPPNALTDATGTAVVTGRQRRGTDAGRRGGRRRRQRGRGPLLRPVEQGRRRRERDHRVQGDALRRQHLR